MKIYIKSSFDKNKYKDYFPTIDNAMDDFMETIETMPASIYNEFGFDEIVDSIEKVDSRLMTYNFREFGNSLQD